MLVTLKINSKIQGHVVFECFIRISMRRGLLQENQDSDHPCVASRTFNGHPRDWNWRETCLRTVVLIRTNAKTRELFQNVT